jgi:hypothetical protein
MGCAGTTVVRWTPTTWPFTFGFVAQRFHPRFTAELGDVEQVQATDRLSVTIDLRRPSFGVDDQPLADLAILPRHLWQGLRAGQEAPSGLPVGSGPYRPVEAEAEAMNSRVEPDVICGPLSLTASSSGWERSSTVGAARPSWRASTSSSRSRVRARR